GRNGSAPRAKAGTKAAGAAAPALATGVPRSADPSELQPGPDAKSTITEHRNALGQTVYSVSASQFDISPPLRDLAANASITQAVEEEAPSNPRLPPWRTPRSDVPDPVVQSEIPSGNLLDRSFP